MSLKHVLMAAATVTTAFGAGAIMPAAAEPVLVKSVPPEYPRGAERRSLEGEVDLAFEVNDAGQVENVSVVSATMPGVFDSAAVKALEDWKFEKGQPGPGQVTIVFDLG